MPPVPGVPAVKDRVFRDPVHGLIEFKAADRPIAELLDTHVMQRLRRIKQMGFAWLVYPGAEHSRFGHALGAFHIAQRMTRRLERELAERTALHIKVAALLHDVGHGPFSHAWEHVFAGGGHDPGEADRVDQLGQVLRVVVAAVLLALLPYAIKLGFGAIGWKFPHRPGAGGESVSRFRYWRENFDWLRYWYLTNPLLSWPRILTVMLAGVLAQRAGAMARVAADARLARRLFATAFPIAVAGRIALVLLPGRWDPRHWTLARGIVLNEVYYVAIWSLAAVYVAAFALLCQRPGWPARLHWLRAVGRMAFTNYLIQALIVVPICLLLGLLDAITPTRGLLLALGVTAIEIPFSVWWLARFEYGPVEWLWRRATYGARFARLRV